MDEILWIDGGRLVRGKVHCECLLCTTARVLKRVDENIGGNNHIYCI